MQHAANQIHHDFLVELVEPLASPEQGITLICVAELEYWPISHVGERCSLNIAQWNEQGDQPILLSDMKSEGASRDVQSICMLIVRRQVQMAAEGG